MTEEKPSSEKNNNLEQEDSEGRILATPEQLVMRDVQLPPTMDKSESEPKPAGVAKRPGPNHAMTANSTSKRVVKDCPHTDRKYYAKGMCVNCYHRRGRTKKAWACPHTRKTHYSKGLCKYCYLNAYYKHRTTPLVPGTEPAKLG